LHTPAGVSPIETLKKRSEFLRIRGGARWNAVSFVMEARPRRLSPLDTFVTGPGSELSGGERIAGARFGFTVTKKIGNAITRNRIRRRLREAVRTVAPVCARAGCDYVLIARQGALTQQFALLIEDLKTAFHRIHAILDGNSTRRGRRPRRGAQAKPKSG
jgi:ribonuclease P protein component